MAVSSPSGDVHGADECASVCAALAPDEATIERVPCSSPGHAEDLVAAPARHAARARRCSSATSTPSSRTPSTSRCSASASSCSARGSGRHEGRRHPRHRRAAGLRQAPRALRRSSRCCSSATRSGGRPTSATSSASRASTPACASRPASSRATTRASSCAARPRARSTSPRHGRSAHSGSAPDRGRNALLALAAAAQIVAARHDPHGPAHLTAVPTVHALRRRVQRRPRRGRAVLRRPRRRSRRDRARAGRASRPRSTASASRPS